MTKSDKSLHNICIAAIKRSTMKPYDFKWTMFYEFDQGIPASGLPIIETGNERMICSTFIDAENYSILTTRQLITKQNGQLSSGSMDGAIDKAYGDFKGYQDKLFTVGQILLQNGTELNYFIETGRASMVMIYGVRTLIRTSKMTALEVEKKTRIWSKQNGD